MENSTLGDMEVKEMSSNILAFISANGVMVSQSQTYAETV
jgi:hypothetical protein